MLSTARDQWASVRWAGITHSPQPAARWPHTWIDSPWSKKPVDPVVDI